MENLNNIRQLSDKAKEAIKASSDPQTKVLMAVLNIFPTGIIILTVLTLASVNVFGLISILPRRMFLFIDSRIIFNHFFVLGLIVAVSTFTGRLIARVLIPALVHFIIVPFDREKFVQGRKRFRNFPYRFLIWASKKSRRVFFILILQIFTICAVITYYYLGWSAGQNYVSFFLMSLVPFIIFCTGYTQRVLHGKSFLNSDAWKSISSGEAGSVIRKYTKADYLYLIYEIFFGKLKLLLVVGVTYCLALSHYLGVQRSLYLLEKGDVRIAVDRGDGMIVVENVSVIFSSYDGLIVAHSEKGYENWKFSFGGISSEDPAPAGRIFSFIPFDVLISVSASD